MIFETTREAIRRGIERSGLRMNLLRICARAPRTIHDLIHAPRYPGIEMDLFSLQSEINVTVELGECKNRGLMVSVGRVPDPIVRGGTTELVRTSLLAFLLSPELARAEPAAYTVYIKEWLAPLGEGWQETATLFAAFPELATKAFYSHAEAEIDDPYFQGDPRRVFGCYHIRDLPVEPRTLGFRDLWKTLTSPPVGTVPAHVLKGSPLLRLAVSARGRLCTWRRRDEAVPTEEVEPLAGPEFFPSRLLPVPIELPAHRSSTKSRS